ncbi:hypothetical protein [Gordonia effusa]|uniref:hypothetical protein n=1 Tax=Gordonia effusa TaxID=263908 RepID=UPI000300D938|nr:hypothetical protein [Gordonia effusa]
MVVAWLGPDRGGIDVGKAVAVPNPIVDTKAIASTTAEVLVNSNTALVARV